MNIETVNPTHAYLLITRKMLEERRAYGVQVRFPLGDEPPHVAKVFDEVYAGKTELHHGVRSKWRDYLTSAIFPWHYYNEHKQNLMAMLKDERIWGPPGYRGKDVTHNFFGRMCRPRPGLKENFMEYTIRRFRSPKHRVMPHFYFDVNEPEWIWHDLVNNPNMIKTGRSACTCVVNIAWRWDALKKRPITYMIVKHSQTAHIYGDIFGANMMLKAFCKELGFRSGEVILFFISISMDNPKESKEILRRIE